LASWPTGAADGVLGEITVVLAGAQPKADVATLVAEVLVLVDDGAGVKARLRRGDRRASPARPVAACTLRRGSGSPPLKGHHVICLRWSSSTVAPHAADCWDLTIDEIHRRAPELTVLAVDLPGRRGKPGDLWTLTIADWVDSVVRGHRGRRSG